MHCLQLDDSSPDVNDNKKHIIHGGILRECTDERIASNRIPRYSHCLAYTVLIVDSLIFEYFADLTLVYDKIKKGDNDKDVVLLILCKNVLLVATGSIPSSNNCIPISKVY